MPGMEAPERISPKPPGNCLEIMSKAVCQSGMSYKIVKSQWHGTRGAFQDFDAAKAGGMTPSGSAG